VINVKIGFIGAGTLGEAFISGLEKTGQVPMENLYASDVNEERLHYIKETYQINACLSNRQLVQECDIIVIAIKPQTFKEALSELRESFLANKLVISVVAGVSVDKLYKYLPDQVSVARVMPNTPCLIGKGVSAVTFSENVTEIHREWTITILEAVGKVHVLPEGLMDAVTGLSGSGPAYIYLVIEALSDAGVRAGLPRDLSQDLAVQTVMGAAAMVEITKTHPAVLKEKVTTPAGTTISGLHVLERAGVRVAFMDAVMAAAQRSKELGSD
jgi:pyrroline-5-carboxylate reductase